MRQLSSVASSRQHQARLLPPAAPHSQDVQLLQAPPSTDPAPFPFITDSS